MVEEVKQRLLEFIEAQRYATLITVSRSGYPYTRTIGYLPVGFQMDLITRPESLKVTHLRHHPQVALVWSQPTVLTPMTITLQGDAELIDDPNVVKEVMRRYGERYPRTAPMMRDAPPELRLAVRVRPRLLRAEGFEADRRAIIVREF
jgi:general stress protein 26